jgi:hypothetical protein
MSRLEIYKNLRIDEALFKLLPVILKFMNKRWHDRHKMPRDATDREKLKWHQKHQKQCGCRPIPNRLLSLVKKEREVPEK